MKIQVALAFAFLALAPAAASAESQDEQNACMNDAFNVCGHAIPDRDRVGGVPRAKHQPHLGGLPHRDAALFQAAAATAARAKLSTATDPLPVAVRENGFLRKPAY